MNNARLFPVVAFAALCLLGLKMLGLVFSGAYVLSGYAPVSAQEATTADAKQSDGSDLAGQAVAQAATNNQANAGTNAAPPPGPAAANQPAVAAPSVSLPGQTKIRSKAEESLLNSLAKRRQKLDALAKELKLKENLIKAAEKQVSDRVAKLKQLEKKLTKQKGEHDEDASKQMSRLVKMYSEMKPAAAARIFNRLDISILKQLVNQMKTRKMAPILAAMDPKRAELLTLEIANKGIDKQPDFADLPKIPAKQ